MSQLETHTCTSNWRGPEFQASDLAAHELPIFCLTKECYSWASGLLLLIYENVFYIPNSLNYSLNKEHT